MIIYGVSLSPFVRKAMAVFGEKGLDFDHQLVMPASDDPEFRETSPFGKVPGFRDGDFTLSDSTAIAHYIESKFPEPTLIPNDPEARAKTIWFDEFGDTMLVPAGGAIFFNRVVAPMTGQEADEAAAVTAERETLPPLLAYLEGLLDDDRDYLVGDSISLADIAVAAPFKNLEYGKAAIDWDAYPKMRAYTDRILGRDSFTKILAMDAAMMGG